MRDTLTKEEHTVPCERRDFLQQGEKEASQALSGADCVFVTVPDIPSVRYSVMSQLLKSLARRQVAIVMIRGGQGGALWLAECLTDPRAATWEVLLVEDSLYGCRARGNHVDYKRKSQIGVAHYGKDPKLPLEAIARALGDPEWPSRFVLRTPSEIVFDPLGYYIHTAVALDPSNVVRTARGQRYLHYSEGIDSTLSEQLDAMDVERVELAAAYGVETQTFPQILRRQYGHQPRSTFYATMAATRDLYRSLSPPDVDGLRRSRTLREDIPALFTMLELARVENVAMPTTVAFADALPYLLGRIGLVITDIGLYPSLPRSVDGDAVRRLLDDGVKHLNRGRNHELATGGYTRP
ncbi:NAD/NADP octopine/nopaline dehydrogenase family protein [Streptomyces sp. NPDC102364]|uniref:NAD/NADP octopine/nopaline dehydrogenase family protein n=1 Tax=Streptomyces sp. NPDC102364 TaxID=3366161 RepID=UPI0037F6C799